MGLIQLSLIGAGLAMDAFSVAICKGLKMQKIDKKYTILLAAFFGFFQGGMPVLGFLLGSTFEQYIKRCDHWIAFILLTLVGGKMIWEAFHTEGDSCTIRHDLKELTVLAFATSIDAMAVGLTFAFLDMKEQIVFATLIIGGITFVISACGVLIGHRFGSKYKNKAELAGGVILILIGCKILAEHMGWFSFLG